jgi:Zn-dependent protease
MEQLLLILPILILSVVVHEYAHGWMALREGDQTAAMLGRLTLNPIPHLDPIGSLIVPGILALTGAPVLGWAKPVPVNSRNFRNYKRGDILVSLAGVAANFLLAILFTLLLVALFWLVQVVPAVGEYAGTVGLMFRYGVYINIILIVFNLLPIPPLDGSHVMYHLLPPQAALRYREIGRYGFMILFALLFLTGFRFIIWPVSVIFGTMMAFYGLLTGTL